MKMKMKIILLMSFYFLCLSTKAQTYQWAKKIGGPLAIQINAMTTDNQGNIFVAGFFNESMDFDPGPGIDLHTSAGGDDIFFAKYDSSGNLLWAKSLPGDAFSYIGKNDRATKIEVDAEGYVYIVGTFATFVDFDPGPGTAVLSQTYNPTANNLFVAKYNASGNYIWAKNFGRKSFTDDRVVIKIDDASANIYLSGFFTGTADFDPGVGVTALTSTGQDIYIAKYDNAGNYVWAKDIGGAGVTSSAKTLAINKNSLGNIIIAGTFGGFVDFDPSAANAVLNGNGGNSFFAEYNPSGNYVRAKSFEGGNSTIFDIVLDTSDNIYIAGNLQGTADFDPSTSTAELTSSFTDNFFAKFDAVGNYLFAKKLPGDTGYTNAVEPNIAIDSYRNIYVSGYFTGTSGDFDPGVGIANLTNVSSVSRTIFFGKYDVLGNYQWANKIGNHPGSGNVFASKINNLNELLIAGTFSGTTDFNPGSPVNNLLDSGAFIAKYTSGSPLGINDYLQFPNDISIYPNPAHDNLSIQTAEKLISIKCTNYLGQNIVLKFENNSANISSLSTGVYLLKIISESGKTTVKKFVKN